MTAVLVNGHVKTGRDAEGEDGYVKTEAEIGVLPVHTKENQGLLAATRSSERGAGQAVLHGLQEEPTV